MSLSPDPPRHAQTGAGRTAEPDSNEVAQESTLSSILRDYPSLRDRQSVERLVASGLPRVIENLPLEQVDTSLASHEPATQLRSPTSERERVPIAPPPRPDELALVSGPPLDLALLPMPYPFVDRVVELEWIKSRLGKDGAPGIVAVCGMGGIGKTGLVAKAIHELSKGGCFRDGIAVILCQHVQDPLAILMSLLARFDAERRRPDDSDVSSLRDEVFRLLARKDVLIVLDNVEMELDFEVVVAPLRAAGIKILVTAREQLPTVSVPKDSCLVLDLLTPEQALDLFAQSYARPNAGSLTAAERLAASRIVKILGYHTLAVRLAGAYAADVRRDLATLARDFEDPERAMALSEDGRERSVALVFEESLRKLERRDADLFAALSVFNGPDFGRHAAIAVAAGLARGEGAPATFADELSIDRLVRRALLSAYINKKMPPESDLERLSLHPLLCALASKKLNAGEGASQRRQRVSRLVADYYVRYGKGKRVSALSPDEGNVTGALKVVHEQEHYDLVMALCLTMRRFWLDGWRTHDSLEFLPWGIDAAEHIVGGDPSRENRLYVADLLRTYGQVLRRAGYLDNAAETLQRALHLCQEEQDTWREAATLSQLGRVAWAQAHLDAAYDYFMRSSARFREAGGDRQREGANQGYLGRIAQARGKLKEAQPFYERSLEIAREKDDRHGQRVMLFALGQLVLSRGEMNQAATYFDESLEICKEEHDYQGESDIRTGLGRIALNRREFDVARTNFQNSLEICEEVGYRQGMGVNFSQLGQVALESGQLDEAERYVRMSLLIRREVKDRRGEGVDVSLLARIALERGNLDDAQKWYEQAQSIAREVQNRRGEGVNCYYLAVIAEAHGDFDTAEKLYGDSVSIAQETENGPDIARAQRAQGRFLIERRGDHQRGDPLLVGAAQRLDELELPEAEAAHELAHRLGAERVKRESVFAGVSNAIRGFGRREP